MSNAVSIPMSADAQFSESITLDGNEYFLRFIWNIRGGFYSMSINDSNNNPLISGIKLTMGCDLLSPYNITGRPPGILFLLDQNPITAVNEPGRNDFISGRNVLLVYQPIGN
jgi:hypothetical protein